MLDTVVSGRVGHEPARYGARLADTQPIADPAPAPGPMGTVHVLRRHRRHLLVGTLLSHTPQALTDHQARTWATRELRLGTASLLPWKLLDEADPAGGWHTTSGLLVEQYALYRHPDGWYLLGAVTRAPRSRIATDDDVKAWATDVLCPPTPLSWDRGPVTQNTTTWYAAP